MQGRAKPDNIGTRILRLTNLLYQARQVDELKKASTAIAGLRNSKPDRMILGELFLTRYAQHIYENRTNGRSSERRQLLNALI
jgi:hypothetical protein